MRAQPDDEPDRSRGRRRARLLVWLGVLVPVVIAAAFVLRGRRTALPAFVEQRRPDPVQTGGPTALPRATTAPEPDRTPAPRHRAAPSPAAGPAVEPVAAVPTAQPVVEPVAEPTAEPVTEPVAEPLSAPTAEPAAVPAVTTPSPSGRGAGLAQLVRVSGLGRRSAEALVVAGIASLEDLAAADPTALAAALDAAGVKRSATVTSWPQQAARLLDGPPTA